MKLKLLAAPFPKQSVHWRAQFLSRSGEKALALAYLDARDVQDRLDLVCGPENWQSRYVETPRGRIICEIGLRIGDQWVWKSDGAGETQLEAEKGGISDALKRAAVNWGIGRYLYRIGAPWVPCDTYEGQGGKKRFRKWTENPWDHVKGAPPAPEDQARELYTTLRDSDDVEPLLSENSELLSSIEILVPSVHEHLQKLIEERKAA